MSCEPLNLARPERFERPTAWFVARYSIQLSYGRVIVVRSLYTTKRCAFSCKAVKMSSFLQEDLRQHATGATTTNIFNCINISSDQATMFFKLFNLGCCKALLGRFRYDY